MSSSCCRSVLALVILGGAALAQAANGEAPWGRSVLQEVEYQPQKVVYDVAVSDVEAFSRVLDRASFLNNLYGGDPFRTSIVLVLHGKEIDFFAVAHYAKYRELMTRAQSLTVGETIEFRICGTAARMRGLEAEDLHGFVETVPMADAEIVRLQREEGYAYMR